MSKRVLWWAVGVLGSIATIQLVAFASGYPPFGLNAGDLFTAVTALATVLLALFAFKAWTTSQETLAAMKKQADDADKRIIESQDQQRRAIEIEALAPYLRILHDLANVGGEAPTARFIARPGESVDNLLFQNYMDYSKHIKELTNEMKQCGTLWRMHHGARRTDMVLFARAENLLARGQQWQRTTSEDSVGTKNIQMAMNKDFAEVLIGASRDWQMRVSDRHRAILTLREEILDFVNDSPAKPKDFDPNTDL